MRRIGIVVTDGESRYPDETKQEAQLAKDDGIRLIAVGVGVSDIKIKLALSIDRKRSLI